MKCLILILFHIKQDFIHSPNICEVDCEKLSQYYLKLTMKI